MKKFGGNNLLCMANMNVIILNPFGEQIIFLAKDSNISVIITHQKEATLNVPFQYCYVFAIRYKSKKYNNNNCFC